MTSGERGLHPPWQGTIYGDWSGQRGSCRQTVGMS